MEQYVEFVHMGRRGVRYRNKLIGLNSAVAQRRRRLHGNKNLYRSMLFYTAPDSDLSVGERFGQLWFDIDAHSGDLEHAIADARTLCSYLLEDNLVPETAIQVWFSGGGLHIGISQDAVGVTPRGDLAQLYGYIANSVIDELKLAYADRAIYDPRRLWRLEGSINTKYGDERYKICINVAELATITPAELVRRSRRNISAQPAVPTVRIQPVDLFGRLMEDYESSEYYASYQRLLRASPSAEDFLGERCDCGELIERALGETNRLCMRELLTRRVRVGHRDDVAYTIASEAVNCWGYSAQEAEALLKALRNDHFDDREGYTNAEIETKVRRAQDKGLRVLCGKGRGKLRSLITAICNPRKCDYHAQYVKGIREERSLEYRMDRSAEQMLASRGFSRRAVRKLLSDLRAIRALMKEQGGGELVISREMLSGELRCGVRTVARRLRALEEVGLLQVQCRRGRGAKLRLVLTDVKALGISGEDRHVVH